MTFISIVGTILTLLIRHGDLPGTIQKISAFYVLYDLFKSDGQTESPFLPFILNALEAKDPVAHKLNIIERNFLLQLLSPNQRTQELEKLTPNYILQADIVTNPLQKKVLAVRAACTEKLAELPATVKCGLMNIVPAPPLNHLSENKIKPLFEGLLKNDSPIKNTFAPTFMTISPPLLACEDELIWFDLTNPAWHKPVYDSTMVSTNTKTNEAKSLITQAFKQALNLQDQQTLLKELEEDSNLVYHLGLTPTKLPSLVENNPIVAIEILLKLMNSTQITEYFSVLVNMELTLHSMEVVNRLTTTVDLPTEFVHLYICNCISHVEKITDRYLQNRLVRLVCVFLQSLIRNKIVNVKDLTLEVEAFCVEFSRIKEAAALYRLLRQLELGEISIGNLKTKE